MQVHAKRHPYFITLAYRNYDPILGRMNGVDPMASKYASLTPYNYSFNDPVTFNDPNGADPYNHYSGGSGYYFSGGYYTYDDVAPNNMGEFHSAFGWRDSYSMGFMASAMGYGRMSSWQSSSFAGMDSKRRNDRVEIDWDLLGDGVYTFQFNDRGGLVYFSQLSVYSNSSEYGTSYFLQDRYGYNQYFASVGYVQDQEPYKWPLELKNLNPEHLLKTFIDLYRGDGRDKIVSEIFDINGAPLTSGFRAPSIYEGKFDKGKILFQFIVNTKITGAARGFDPRKIDRVEPYYLGYNYFSDGKTSVPKGWDVNPAKVPTNQKYPFSLTALGNSGREGIATIFFSDYDTFISFTSFVNPNWKYSNNKLNIYGK